MTFVRHTKMTAWGTGIVVEERTGMRTVLFADGQRRALKATHADTLLVPAEPTSVEEGVSLVRGRGSNAERAAPATNLALEAQIAAGGFDDPGPFLVYADWLIQQGDPRGDLIHVQHLRVTERGNAAAEKRETKLFKDHGRYFAPDAFRKKGDHALSWRLGFIAAAALGELPGAEGAAKLAALLAHPSAEYLRELTLGAQSYHPSPVAAIAAANLGCLATLSIGGPIETSALDAGDITALFALPALTSLTLAATSLQVRGPLGDARSEPPEGWCMPGPRLASLRHLAIAMRREDAGAVAALVGLAAPVLAHFELACLGGTGSVPPAAFAQLPAVQTLVVRGTTDTAGWFARVVASPCAANLRVLALPDGDLTDAALPALVAARAQLPNLTALDLDGNQISEAGARVLAGYASDVRTRARPPRRPRRAGAPPVLATPAARAIADVARWQVIGYDRARDRAWGEYRGTAGTYAVYADATSGRTACNCPSREDPCKHALALRILLDDGAELPPRAPLSDAFYDTAAAAPRYESTWE